jgi:hypothetical protein
MKGKILVLYERGSGMGRGVVMSDEDNCRLSKLAKKGEIVITNPISEFDESRIDDSFRVTHNANIFCLGKAGEGISIHR